ncbi:hypothetical protein [Pseudoxanthomonas beigongshangi]
MSLFKTNTQPDSIHGILEGMVAKAGTRPTVVAPGIARRALQECNFQGQRKIQRNRQMRHERCIREGRWHPEVSTISFARTPDGALHLVNGQHRMAAIAGVGSATPTKIEIIAAKDIDEVRRLYVMYDEPGSSRSDNEALIGINAPENLGLSNRVTAALFRAVALLLNDLEPMGPRDESLEARERDVRLSEMPDWAEAAKTYAGFVARADSDIAGKMLTQGVMASALYTIRYQPKLAKEFWGGLAENDGLRRNDPRSRLLADFRNRDTTNGNIRQRVQRVAVAWNAFFVGKDLKIIKCIEGGRIVFKGTPKGRGG